MGIMPLWLFCVNDLQKENEETDGGVVIDSSHKCELHVAEKINKGNKVAGFIKRNFSYLDINTFLTLYIGETTSRICSVFGRHTKQESPA